MDANAIEWKLNIASAGFTFGFGVLTAWNAVQQTVSIQAPLKNVYLLFIWVELLSTLGVAVLGWRLQDTILIQKLPGYGMFASSLIVIFGTLQTQCHLQIIMNRTSLLLTTKKALTPRLQWGIGISMTALSTSGIAFCMSRISTYHFETVKYSNHGSKVVLLIVDILLNCWFLQVVRMYLKQKAEGNEHTSSLHFQLFLAFINLILDSILLGLSSLNNPVLYLQCHSVVYIIKLNIGMSMANFVARVSRGSDCDENWSFIPPLVFSIDEPAKVKDTLYHHSVTVFVPGHHGQVSSIVTSASDGNIAVERERISGMKATKDVLVTVEQNQSRTDGGTERSSCTVYERPLSKRNSEASLEGGSRQFQY